MSNDSVWCTHVITNQNYCALCHVEKLEMELSFLKNGIKILGDRFHENDPLSPSEFYELAESSGRS